MNEPLHSPLHDKHIALEAKMGQESSWLVPLSYGGTVEEAVHTRQSCGLLDLSHTGRLRVRGDDALALLERVCTCDVARQEDSTARPTLLCNRRGGIIDQSHLVRLEDSWLLLTSGANREKVLEHLAAAGDGLDVKVDDHTERTAHIAVYGPMASGLLDKVLPFSVSDLPAGAVREESLLIAKYIGMRRDLGRLWGLEVIMPAMFATKAWEWITSKGGENAARPTGQAAWEVLRIEEGVPRYGHEINETIDPVTADLADQVDWDRAKLALTGDNTGNSFSGDSRASAFIGAEALVKLRNRTPARKRVGLILSPKDTCTPQAAAAAGLIPRHGTPVLDADGAEIGTVTSGTYSPMLDKLIAMAYISSACAQHGTTLQVSVNGQVIQAALTPLPFQ